MPPRSHLLGRWSGSPAWSSLLPLQPQAGTRARPPSALTGVPEPPPLPPNTLSTPFPQASPPVDGTEARLMERMETSLAH